MRATGWKCWSAPRARPSPWIAPRGRPARALDRVLLERAMRATSNRHFHLSLEICRTRRPARRAKLPRQMSVSSKYRDKGTRRTRTGRASLRNQVYHLVTTTLHRRKVFDDLYVARQLVLALRRQDLDGFTSTLACCVMPDHLHWLVQLCGDRKLQVVVDVVKSESCRRINELRGARGPLWQRGYYERAIRRDDDLITVARYIVANPLRGGLARSLRQYPHWYARWI